MNVEIGLSAAIAAFRDGRPAFYVADDALPSGAFDPSRHRTFERALRDWALEQTGLMLGYVEQLYTFGDRGRHSVGADTGGTHVVSVGYLALTRADEQAGEGGTPWRDWYELLPWEDWREGRPAMTDRLIVPGLRAWASEGTDVAARERRIALNFGAEFDDERALDRYELLYEAGMLPEAVRDGRGAGGTVLPGRAMRHDHRRIAATAIARLRSKVRYRPVIFEMMPDAFTLFELQRAAEAIAGRPLHKQNFRRLVESAGLVEPTGGFSASKRGRPAALFRFRREIVTRSAATGLRLGRR